MFTFWELIKSPLLWRDLAGSLQDSNGRARWAREMESTGSQKGMRFLTKAGWKTSGANANEDQLMDGCPSLLSSALPSLFFFPTVIKGRIFHLQHSFQHCWQAILYTFSGTISFTLLNTVLTNHYSFNLSVGARSWSQASFRHNYICTLGKGTKKKIICLHHFLAPQYFDGMSKIAQSRVSGMRWSKTIHLNCWW